MSADIFFQDWQHIVRTIAVGLPAYAILVLLLRISGKRTLTKLNAFDLVVTVALGSTLATVLTSRSVTLAQGVTAMALLILTQAVITWLSVRSRGLQKLIKAQPALLYYDGAYVDRALRRERVTRVEVEAAVRSQGIGSLEAVEAVILETDGSISVLTRESAKPGSGLLDNLASSLQAGPPPGR